ncbi:uncharacterized protein LOC123224171 isoform X2 [Mangifera indica]|uniref:uncharacterized protein LOC123224171 isoform X2 n=1 Tax=Mangifera indica TaxID=29780 RepID=UPI001CFAA2E3|nr:uncharacterized protein LOC123224171 isoform X2 [Mangifera indica]
MAVVFEGFSIREYAAKMRSVDVVKCWPFSGGTDEIVNKEDIDRLLPPITVTKFRWWSHELDLLRSSNNSNSSSVVNAEAEEDNKLVEEEEEEEKLDMVCPVCRVFTAATVNALNAHIDNCLVQASREERRRMRLAIKAKSRPPKKRSIVEIFAESRQIDKLDVNDDNLHKVDGQQHELDCTDVEFNSKIVKKKKKKMKKVKILNKLMHNKKKLKNKSLKNKLITNNKENPNKLKLQTPVKFKRKVNDSVCNKGLAKGILDSVIIHRKKQDLKHKSLRKRHRIVKTTKLVTENQESVVPVRGILKNHKRDVLVQNASICSAQTGSQVNPCDIHHSDRHVRFSGKDDILGPSKRNVSSFENNICRLYSDSITSSEKDRSTESEDQLATLNGINGDVVSISLEQETVVQPLIEKDLFPCSHASVDIPNFQRPHKIPQEKLKNFSDKSVDNLCMFDRSNHLTSYGPSYADTQLLSALNKVSNPCVNPQFHGSVSKASNSSARFIDHFENSSHGVAEMSSMANMRQISQPSSTAFALDESAELRLPSPAENMTGHGMQFPPCTDLSTVEFRSSLCPFPEWNQRAVSFRQNCMSEEFFGLPLNSQGELIQASSNGKGCYNQLNKSNLEAGSSSGFPVLNHELQRNMGDCSSSLKERRYVERFFPKDQLNLFPGENYVKENPNLHLPARLGVAESPVTTEDVHRINSRTGSSHYVPLLDSEQNLKNISFDRFRQYDQAQNQDGIGVDHPKENSDQMLLNTTQLTMRLMGKDVAIGRSSKEMQGFRDGQVWTDKEIISEHCTSSTGPENLSVKSHFQNWLKPASGKLNQPLEIHSSQASQSNPLMRGPDSRFFHPYGNWKTNTVFENGIHPVNRNHSSKLHTIANPLPLQEMLNWTGNLQETFIPGPDTSSVSSHAGSAPHINSQLRDWSPAGFPYKQNQPQVTKSAFSFPFLHSDHVEPVQQSWFQSSSKSLVPWLLQTKQVKAPASVPFAGFDGKYYPHSTEPNLPVIPSFHQSPVAYPYNFMTSQTPMQSSLGPVALVHPSFVSAHSGTQPISSINMNYRNRNRAKNRMQSKALGIKSLNHCQKTKKMPASIDGYSTNAAKISNLVQEDSSAVMEFTREDYGGNIRCNAGASETNFYKDRASSSGCDPLEVQEDVYSMTGLASGGNFIQDIQYNGGSLKLNSDCVGASGVGCAPNESLNFGVRTSLVYDSSKVDGIGRSGPIKLSAGAKHILKPSQNMDQDNSRLVHSTIPFATAPDSAYLRESQKKSTKVYRF